MKKYLLFLLYSLVAISIKAQPPNNAIFFGGGGDGATGLSYSVSANTIFIGGIGDGAAIATNNRYSYKQCNRQQFIFWWFRRWFCPAIKQCGKQ